MSWFYLRDSLPWLVPSAAIIFAASVFIERTSGEDGAATPPEAAIAVSTQSTDSPVAGQPVQSGTEFVARLATATDPLSDLQATTALVQPPTANLAQPTTPERTVLPREAALSGAATATPLFKSDAVAAATQSQCLEDLRNLADTARVYFPSGGLTADEGGIERGRLIGLVAQNCEGVRIRVEGHSDPSGDPAANLRLSQQRAEQVITRIATAGLDTSMFFAEGMGDRQPSNVVGPEPKWYYDRRVQFEILKPEDVQRVAVNVPAQPSPWADAACVMELQRAVDSATLFYAPRSISVQADELETAMRLAQMAMDCPYARLRVIGLYSGDLQSGETVQTGMLRAKALRAMLVGRGVASDQVIIAAPSRPRGAGAQLGLPGARVDFDVIVEEG